MCAAQTAATVWLYYNFAYYGHLWVCFIGWISILVLLVFGKKFLNKRTGFTAYFNRASYPIYILRQSILVALAYYVTQVCDDLAAQAFGVCAGSFALTIFAYHVIVKVPIARVMIGIREKKRGGESGS